MTYIPASFRASPWVLKKSWFFDVSLHRGTIRCVFLESGDNILHTRALLTTFADRVALACFRAAITGVADMHLDPRGKPGAIVVLPMEETDPFEELVILGPSHHRIRKADEPSVWERTFLIFPAYRCEITGSEESNALAAKLDRYVDWGNWQREKTLMLQMRFRLDQNAWSRPKKERRYIDHEALDQLLPRVTEPAAFLEVENWKGEVVRVTALGDTQFSFSRKSESEAVRVDRHQGAEWLRSWGLAE